jgi:ribosomal protein S18 acetylase RimI-like enzyme
MVKITEITPALFPKFYRCFEILMQEGYAGFPFKLREYFIKKEYSLSNFILWNEKQFRKFFLAIDNEGNGEIVGFLVGDNTYGGVAFITWIGVLPNFRHLGIGRQLLEVYEAYVKTKHAHLLELFTYEAVKPFYLKLGFLEIGRREQGFYGQKNIIMNKRIGNWDDNNIPFV